MFLFLLEVVPLNIHDNNKLFFLVVIFNKILIGFINFLYIQNKVFFFWICIIK